MCKISHISLVILFVLTIIMIDSSTAQYGRSIAFRNVGCPYRRGQCLRFCISSGMNYGRCAGIYGRICLCSNILGNGYYSGYNNGYNGLGGGYGYGGYGGGYYGDYGVNENNAVNDDRINEQTEMFAT